MIGVTFEPIFTLGNAVVALATAAALAFVYFRSTSARVWRENAEAERSARERYQALAEERQVEVNRLDGRVRSLQQTIGEVGGARVMEAVVEQSRIANERYGEAMKLVFGQFERLGTSLEAHERRAEQRNAKIVDALDAIARRLDGGP